MLAMWVPEMPFQLACQRDGALRERPLAFLAPEAARTPCLWLVNRRARAEGLTPGDPLDLALRRVPGLRAMDPEPQTWWEAQASLGEFLQHWSPQGLLGRMGEAMVELRGLERLSGPPQDTAARILRELDQAYRWRGHGGLSLSAAAARIASRLERSLEQVPEGFEKTFLAPQPLGRLPDLQAKLCTRLYRLGLRLVGDLQPVPLPILGQLMPEPEAQGLLAQALGEDRPRLPLLADPPGESRHLWRLEPPRLPEEVALAPWCLGHFWKESRSPRRLEFSWWDVDGERHRWKAEGEHLALPPMLLARALEAAFRAGSPRRILVHRLELRVAWGLGRPRSLFQDSLAQKLDRLEPALAKLRRCYPGKPVLPGWFAKGPNPPAAGRALCP